MDRVCNNVVGNIGLEYHHAGVLNFNLDASLFLHQNISEIGMCIHNDKGEFVRTKTINAQSINFITKRG